MDYHNLLKDARREDLRQWLMLHHDTEPECWVICRYGRPSDENALWYLDVVEEALCFGWIDSTRKRLPDDTMAQRLTPRRKGSAWSELNKERCRRQERLGRMTDAGRAVLPDMSDEGFAIDHDILHALQADPIVWANFQALPALYKRVRVDTIQINKRMRRPELFQKRLAKFIENTRRGILYGDWNDYGRLCQD